MAESIETKIGS